MDLFGPLVRIARQYDDPDAFIAGSRRLLEQVKPVDGDCFLGLFPDIHGATSFYAEPGGAATVDLGVFGLRAIEPAFHPVYHRRNKRRSQRLHDLVDFIASGDDESILSGALEMLEKAAPPHTEPEHGILAPFREKDGLPFQVERADWTPPESLP